MSDPKAPDEPSFEDELDAWASGISEWGADAEASDAASGGQDSAPAEAAAVDDFAPPAIDTADAEASSDEEMPELLGQALGALIGAGSAPVDRADIGAEFFTDEKTPVDVAYEFRNLLTDLSQEHPLPAPTDSSNADDDYDQFSVETASTPEPVTEHAAPNQVAQAIVQPTKSAKIFDPDKTPLPFGDDEDIAPERPLGAHRLPRVEKLPALSAKILADSPKMSSLDGTYRTNLQRWSAGLVAAETEPVRKAGWLVWQAHAADLAGDMAASSGYFQAAGELHPESRVPGIGLSRGFLKQGSKDRWFDAFVSRLDDSLSDERRALRVCERAFNRVSPDHEHKAAADADDLTERLWRVDCAIRLRQREALDEQLKCWAQTEVDDSVWQSAIWLWYARLSEGSESWTQAKEAYSASRSADGQRQAPFWGLWRIALIENDTLARVDAEQQLLDRAAAIDLQNALFYSALSASHHVPVQDAIYDNAWTFMQSGAADSSLLRMMANLAARRRIWDHAEFCYGRLVETDNAAEFRADWQLLRGTMYEKLGRTGDAYAIYQELMGDSVDVRAEWSLDRTAGPLQDQSKMLDRYRDHGHSRGDTASLARAAILSVELGLWQEAIASLRLLLNAHPHDLFATALVSDIIETYQPDDAAMLLRPVIEAWHGSAVEPLLTIQLLRRHQRGEGQAENVAEWARRGAIRLIDVGRLRDQTWFSGKESAALIAQLADQLVEKSPALARQCYVEAASQMGQAARPPLLRKALALGEPDAAIAIDLLSVLYAEGREEEAATVFERVARAAGTGKEFWAAQFRWGLSLIEDAADPEVAKTVIRDLVDQTPNWPPGERLLSSLARRSHDLDLLVRHCREELSRATTLADRFTLWLHLGELHEERARSQSEGISDWNRAISAFREAFAMRPCLFAYMTLTRATLAARQYGVLADVAGDFLKERKTDDEKLLIYEQQNYLYSHLRTDEALAFEAASLWRLQQPTHPIALRSSEEHFIRLQKWQELAEVYEELARSTSDQQLVSVLHLERAKLHARIAANPTEIAADFQLALQADATLWPALFALFSIACTEANWEQITMLSAELAGFLTNDGRSAAVLLTRSAEARLHQKRFESAKERLEEAVAREELHLPALVRLLDLALQTEDWATVAAIAEREAQVLSSERSKVAALLLAGSVAQVKLEDNEQAERLFRRVLEIQPKSREAFACLRMLFLQSDKFTELVLLYQQQIGGEEDRRRRILLRLELAEWFLGPLADHEQARTTLQMILVDDVQQRDALRLLSDLYYNHQEWADALDVLLKRTKVETREEELRSIYFRLGTIYAGPLPDLKRAVASFARVLRSQPNQLEALEHLADLLQKQGDWQGAQEATSRLIDLETRSDRKIRALLRMAKIYEDGFRDARAALDVLKVAVELDVLHLAALSELTQFFLRQSDVQSMRIHLDMAAAKVRQLLEHDLYNATAYHTLFKIFAWRKMPDRAAIAAEILQVLGAADAEEAAFAVRAAERDWYPGVSLGTTEVDDLLFDARITPGFRHLFRRLEDSLLPLFRADIRRLGIDRKQRLPKAGHPVRDLANLMARDLGIDKFDLYISSHHGQVVMIELTDPPSIVLGAHVVERANDKELRFVLGRALKTMQTGLLLPSRLSAPDLALLLGAVVRQFVPDFVPPGFSEATIADEAARFARVIPRRLHQELAPFALECASMRVDWMEFSALLVEMGNRAGLLAAGSVGAAMTVLRRMGEEQQLRELLRYSLSDEWTELRRRLGLTLSG